MTTGPVLNDKVLGRKVSEEAPAKSDSFRTVSSRR
eukprot:CAMPEP_0201105686 /NCGR_PEP_ID=MMETSP0812-20130820/47282_1 /ASSEMBLY_ACC=CAM_ASM_000668 /TAXON_ID=98059 /ORGANISM="Dinobryon sp., Strain UTEXLB2267" /LENGTH=34 /DNA_ID= /DNA_START= /DNA_END= /DNA_ORIENTATION=